MSTPVEGKPWRYVWWCVEHDSQQDRAHVARCELALAMGHVSDAAADLDCRFVKMRLDPVGYVTPEWGNDD